MSRESRCGAHARSTGKPCCAPPMQNGRCRLHGGLSTGPQTSVGREAVAKSVAQRMASGQKQRAQVGFSRWLVDGGRDFLVRTAKYRFLGFGVSPR